LAGETEVLGENLPQRYFVHHKSLLPDPGSNPDRLGGKPETNRLSYGATDTRLGTSNARVYIGQFNSKQFQENWKNKIFTASIGDRTE
jgi:hypothetical protein